ncbi:hypothetical protein B0H14DRAFT_3729794 [Mycena olivaceomarginata]|nr:hypothetical protein B0H14DRAFT_3729794 [Mycena olivaceomarginata]
MEFKIDWSSSFQWLASMSPMLSKSYSSTSDSWQATDGREEMSADGSRKQGLSPNDNHGVLGASGGLGLSFEPFRHQVVGVEVPNGTLVAHGPEACCDCAPIRAITATSHFFQVSFEHTHLFLPSSLFLGRMITKLASNHRLHYHATTISHVIVFNLERHTRILGGRNIGLGSISIFLFYLLSLYNNRRDVGLEDVASSISACNVFLWALVTQEYAFQPPRSYYKFPGNDTQGIIPSFFLPHLSLTKFEFESSILKSSSTRGPESDLSLEKSQIRAELLY